VVGEACCDESPEGFRFIYLVIYADHPRSAFASKGYQASTCECGFCGGAGKVVIVGCLLPSRSEWGAIWIPGYEQVCRLCRHCIRCAGSGALLRRIIGGVVMERAQATVASLPQGRDEVMEWCPDCCIEHLNSDPWSK
jgi:hypothetical protein